MCNEYPAIASVNCVLHQLHTLSKAVCTKLDASCVKDTHTIVKFFTRGLSAQVLFVSNSFFGDDGMLYVKLIIFMLTVTCGECVECVTDW